VPRHRFNRFDRTGNGVTFRLSSGTLRVELCSDRVVHVLASATEELPKAATPTVIGPATSRRSRLTNQQQYHSQNKIDPGSGGSQHGSASVPVADGTLILAERADGGAR